MKAWGFAEAFRLGPWTVLPPLHRLRRDDGEEVVLEPKVMRVLQCLAARAGGVVSRDELLDAVWPDEHVTEHVLSRSISALRKTLGDDHRDPTYIETIRKGGFRLVAPVEPLEKPSAAKSPAGRRRTAAGAVLALAAATAAMALVWRATYREPPSAVAPALPVPLTSFRGSELDPVLSPDGQRLAFSWSGADGDNFDVYVKSLDSEAPLRLTTDPGEDKNPAWSPDGERIAFVRSAPGAHGIYAVPLLGGAVRKLADCVSGDIPDLVWSADGRFLFFADREAPDRPSAVFRLDLETLEKRRVTRPPEAAFGDRDLTVSPDGRRVAFARAEISGVEDLYVAAVEGGGPRRLTFDGASINGLEWLADGDEILFSSNRDGTSRLWRIAAAGGAARLAAELGDGAYDPSFAPAALRLVFERKVYDTNVWLLDRDGATPPRPWIASTRWDSAPAVAPDGGSLVFASDRSGHGELWLCASDGSGPRQLTETGSDQPERPAFSPDGERLVFGLRSGGQSDLYLMSTLGGRMRRLTSSSWSEIEPSYSGDGRAVYFGSDQTGSWQIWRLPLAGGEPVQVTREGGIRARESAAGDVLYYSRPDRSGIWRVPVDGGSEVLVFASAEPMHWADWTLAGGLIYFRASPSNPVDPAAIFVFDLATGATSVVIASPPGRNIPGLGLAVAPAEGYLLFGSIDRSDGDVMLVDGFY